MVDPNYSDDEIVLPSSVDKAGLDNFNNVEIATIPMRKCIDVLNGKAEKNVLTVFYESKNNDSTTKNFILSQNDTSKWHKNIHIKKNLTQYRASRFTV